MKRKILQELEHLLLAEIDPAFARRARFIFEIVQREKPNYILDIGCGRGFYIKGLSLFDFPKEIYGIDTNESYLSIAKRQTKDKRIHVQTGSIYQLPFPKNYFDLIICSEVFEHLTDEKRAVAEIKRVLKKQGSLVVTVPHEQFPFLWDPLNWILMRFFHTHINKDIWWLAGIWAGHERLYTKKKLQRIFTDKQLHIITLHGYLQYCWPFSHFLLYGIGKNLVERIKITSFSRFGQKPSRQAQLIAAIFRFPAKFDKDGQTEATVGLIGHIKKV